jgi:DNA-binding MarR family transcriptional regulator
MAGAVQKLDGPSAHGALDVPQDGRTEFVPGYLLYLLAAASEEASAQFHAHVRAQGLRIPEWRVLACLQDADGAMITHLARIALAEQSRLTRIIAQMEERGLVVRRSDPDDGRRVRVFLTPQGRTLSEHLIEDARAHEKRLLVRLGAGDGGHLKPALTALLGLLRADAAPPAPAGGGITAQPTGGL